MRHAMGWADRRRWQGWKCLDSANALCSIGGTLSGYVKDGPGPAQGQRACVVFIALVVMVKCFAQAMSITESV
jgi:hypothetical protein